MNDNSTLGYRSYLKPLIWGTIFGTVTILVLFALFALAITKLYVPATLLSTMIVVAAGCGAFVSGYLASKLIGERGMLVGLISGVIFVIILAVSSLALAGGTFLAQTITKYIVIVVGGILGGIVGVNAKKARR